MKKLLFLPLLLLANLAFAQTGSVQCPNRPAGDSTNQCANTRFVQNNQSGINVQSCYRAGEVDDTEMIRRCIVLATPGRKLFFPARKYTVHCDVGQTYTFLLNGSIVIEGEISLADAGSGKQPGTWIKAVAPTPDTCDIFRIAPDAAVSGTSASFYEFRNIMVYSDDLKGANALTIVTNDVPIENLNINNSWLFGINGFGIYQDTLAAPGAGTVHQMVVNNTRLSGNLGGAQFNSAGDSLHLNDVNFSGSGLALYVRCGSGTASQLFQGLNVRGMSGGAVKVVDCQSLTLLSAQLEQGVPYTGTDEAVVVFDNCFACAIRNSSVNAHFQQSSFTGTIAGTDLTVVGPITGALAVGQRVFGTGVAATTTILSQTSGTPGGAGVYVISIAGAVGPAAMTTATATTNSITLKNSTRNTMIDGNTISIGSTAVENHVTLAADAGTLNSIYGNNVYLLSGTGITPVINNASTVPQRGIKIGPLTLQNGWTNGVDATFDQGLFYKIHPTDNRVDLFGVIVGGTNVAGTILSALPAGARPFSKIKQINGIWDVSSGKNNALNINTNGNIFIPSVVIGDPTAIIINSGFEQE